MVIISYATNGYNVVYFFRLKMMRFMNDIYNVNIDLIHTSNKIVKDHIK
jgi:hypothetical protein